MHPGARALGAAAERGEVHGLNQPVEMRTEGLGTGAEHGAEGNLAKRLNKREQPGSRGR